MRSVGLIACAIGMAAACASFGDGAPPPSSSDGGDAGGATSDAGADAVADAAVEAGNCPRGGRDGGNTCGVAATCVKGQACCFAVTPICTNVNDCDSVQVNCASPNECNAGERCCQVSGASAGTRCMSACMFGRPLCTKDSDCAAGEFCRAPDATQSITHWHCAPCPG